MGLSRIIFLVAQATTTTTTTYFEVSSFSTNPKEEDFILWDRIMVLTAAQTTAFFRNEDQMGVPQETFPHCICGRIVSVADLADFNKHSIKRLAENVNKAGLVFGAKCEQRLIVASNKKEAAVPEIPKISKALPIIKWTEVFQDFLIRVIGVRYIPLSYVIRDQVEVPADAPPLATDQPYSTEHGSI